MGSSRTSAGGSPQLAKSVKLLVLFLFTTAEAATWGDECPVCSVTVCQICPVDESQPKCEQYIDFSIQLRSLKSAQFAGFYAAQEMGYWREECLNVAIHQPSSQSNINHGLPMYKADAAVPHYL
jgi:ABC-type nitrate/sulfonate/bicarbonate transport system substrate-binding protein